MCGYCTMACIIGAKGLVLIGELDRREGNRKLRALAWCALNRQSPTIALDDRPADAQAKPTTIGACGSEWLKDRAVQLACDALAGIAHRDSRAVAGTEAVDGDQATSGHRGHGV